MRRGGRRGHRSAPTAARCLTDPTSAFGGIIAFNRPVDAATAEAVSKQFVEVVIAPAYDEAALRVFAAKKNVRLLALGCRREPRTASR